MTADRSDALMVVTGHDRTPIVVVARRHEAAEDVLANVNDMVGRPAYDRVVRVAQGVLALKETGGFYRKAGRECARVGTANAKAPEAVMEAASSQAVAMRTTIWVLTDAGGARYLAAVPSVLGEAGLENFAAPAISGPFTATVVDEGTFFAAPKMLRPGMAVTVDADATYDASHGREHDAFHAAHIPPAPEYHAPAFH